jgi:hypothetical protein
MPVMSARIAKPSLERSSVPCRGKLQSCRSFICLKVGALHSDVQKLAQGYQGIFPSSCSLPSERVSARTTPLAYRIESVQGVVAQMMQSSDSVRVWVFSSPGRRPREEEWVKR